MIDISDKPVLKRTASASGTIELTSDTIKAIETGQVKKGDALEISRIAAINAIKQTPNLIPMCHQIPLNTINIDWELNEKNIIVEVTVSAEAKTGVEMEALVGVNIALANLWDMVKYLEKDESGQYPHTRISNIHIVSKTKS